MDSEFVEQEPLPSGKERIASMQMRSRRSSGPRRARSVKSYKAYIRQTRILALLALAALAAGVVSDETNSSFWVHHALLAGLVASLIIVALSAAVLNEILERRRRQRWSVLAQYIMFELVRNARMIWSGVLEVAGLLPPQSDRQESLELDAANVRDTPRLTAALHEVLRDDDGRARLRTEIVFLTKHADEVLGRWGRVMLNAEFYAEVIDRHVELAGDIA